jgi:hypothetical protein
MILDSTFLFDLMREDPDAFAKGVDLVERLGVAHAGTSAIGV